MRKSKSLPNLKKQLWKLCREIIGLRYPNICYTCNKPIDGKGKQLGHFIPSSVGGVALRYHLDNLRWQCYNCNINKSGNWPAYLENLTKELGKDRVDALITLKKASISADKYWYEQMIEKYDKILAKILADGL